MSTPNLKTVLIVESVLNDMNTLAFVLKDSYNVKTVSNTLEAITDSLKTSIPDFIFTGVTFPGMDGYEFCRRLKTDSNTQHIPVCLVLGLNDEINTEKLKMAMSDDVLRKPLDPIIVHHRLYFHLNHSASPVSGPVQEIIPKILIGVVSLLSDLMRMSMPLTYCKSIRMAQYVATLVELFELEHGGMYVSAAKMSLIGTFCLPNTIMTKVYSGIELTDSERKLYLAHPSAAFKMFSQIPYMDAISRMIKNQFIPTPIKFQSESLEDRPEIEIGSELIRFAFEYDNLIQRHYTKERALDILLESPSLYDRHLIIAMMNAEQGYISTSHGLTEKVRIEDLKAGMLLIQDIQDLSNEVLVSLGTILTEFDIEKINNLISNLETNKYVIVEKQKASIS